MPKLTKQQIIIIGGVLVALALVFILIFVGKKPSPGTTVNLSVWGTDSSNLFNEKIITKYTALRPNVKIAYTEVPQANYDAAVVSALAAGNGPDVFLIGNHDLASKQALLSPVDPVQYPFANISQLFPDVVGDDFVSGGALYALPLYMDTMALLYNKDVFNQAGIPVPPVTWKDFQNDIPLLRSLGSSGQIVKAAAAIGGSEATVNHAVDLLHLLMLQNGAQMTLPNFSKATFAEGSGGHAPGLGAFQFYLQFANAASSAYTWNENQPQSLQSFGGGETAMLLDYHDAFVSLKKQNPFLNIGIAPMLQISSSSATNYASYEGLAV